jgi:outer membrane receptor for ferrienterochelin and colicin
MQKRVALLFTVLALVLLAPVFYGTEKSAVGIIRGQLLDVETQSPLISANVIIMETNQGAATDLTGSFEIRNMPVGSYSLKFTYIGYAPLIKPDIIVKSQRATFVHAEIRSQTLTSEAVEVTSGYFAQTSDQPVSITQFSTEEIRRAPGSAGDVSRILMSLPSLAVINDQSNSLIVRGGNPAENTFFIDNIEIPNINHFPDQGSSGGPIGVLNVDLIRTVNFFSGGFSSAYGDKLSSVMDIQFREGNSHEIDTQLDLNFAGFGGVAEGPLGNHGSWLVSGRRSYLDFVVKTLNVGSTIAPYYGDLQWKFQYDLSPADRLVFLGIWSDDHNAPDRNTGLDNRMTHYGRQDDGVRTTGMNWRKLWGTRGYSNTSISHTIQTYNQDWFETSSGIYALKNRSREQMLKFRHDHHQIFSTHQLEFGLEGKYMWSQYDNWIGSSTNVTGDSVPEQFIKKTISGLKIGGFLNASIQITSVIKLNAGLRADYFSYTQILNTSPRVSLSCQISNRLKLNAAIGRYFQSQPMLLYSRNEGNRNLKNMESVHTILGFEHLLTENTKFTTELYRKDYSHFPMDRSQPGLFLLDEGYTFVQSDLTDTGQAQTHGVECLLQKKLAKNLYGRISLAYFRARYRGTDGLWRNRKYDNQWTFSAEGGYKPNRNWEFSLRWIAAGGGPYTPVDVESSKTVHRLVQDAHAINTVRYPDYHSMNLRFDRRFNFSSSNLIFYLSIWNVYNQKNVAEYYWNDREQKLDAIYQWLFLPIFGLEFEF